MHAQGGAAPARERGTFFAPRWLCGVLWVSSGTLGPSGEARVTDGPTIPEPPAEGGRQATDEVLPLVYDQLRELAGLFLAGERDGHTLQPTALAHEVYLRLAPQQRAAWNDRVHFMAVAAGMIRRILIDHARQRAALKRGGPGSGAAAFFGGGPFECTAEGLLELHEAVEALRARDERHAQIVELRFFGGLTIADTAALLGISEETVKRDWRAARAWLRRHLEG